MTRNDRLRRGPRRTALTRTAAGRMPRRFAALLAGFAAPRNLIPSGVGLIALLIAVSASAESVAPDPKRAFEDRDLAPIEAWLAAQPEAVLESAARLRARAWLARRDGDDERARRLIDEAIELDPVRADLRVDRAALQSGRLEGAGAFKSMRIARRLRRDLEAALEFDPEHVGAMIALIRFHREAPGIVGGDETRAEALMQRLEQASPAHHQLQRALDAADAGRLVAAIEAIGIALRTAEDPPLKWHVRLGNWLAESGRIDEAFEAYLQALERSPEFPPALYAIGVLSVDSGMRRSTGVEALQALTRSSAWSPDAPVAEAWRLLAVLLEQSGQADAAAAATERSQALKAERDAAEAGSS